MMPFHTQDDDAKYDSLWQRQLADKVHATLEGLSYNSTMETVLEHILQRSRELFFQANAGAIYRFRKKEDTLYIQLSQGLSASYTASMYVALGKGAVGKAVLEQRTIALSQDELMLSVGNSTDIHPQQRKLLEKMFSRFRTLLAIPLIANNEIYGGIVLYYICPYEFTEHTYHLAQHLGNQAASIIENAQRFNEAKDNAVQQERLRIAHDLHDSAIQTLYGITLYTEASLRLLAIGNREVASSYLSEIQKTTIETLQEMRLLVFELRPPLLEQEGIVSALQIRLDAVENRTQMVTSLQIEGDIHLTNQVEKVLYRIAQEALNNILKHAHAHTVTIKLSQNTQYIHLKISDDGVGFDLNTIQKKEGAGLQGIEERITHIGGKLTIDSIPGCGTCIQVLLYL